MNRFVRTASLPFACLSAAVLCLVLANCAVAQKSKDADEEAEPAGPVIPDERGQFRSIRFESAPASSERAWEVRPYQVAVWLCLDGSPKISIAEAQLCQSIETQCHLFDASGWNVRVGTAPSQWHWGLLDSAMDLSFAERVLVEPELEHYDKLMVVRVSESDGQITVDAREFDIRTQQHGPLIAGTTRFPHAIPSIAAKLLTRAFMPLARIDEVTSTNEAFLKSRGIEACIQTRINEDLVPEVVPIRDSPVFVRKSDRFLPIVLRTDRSGKIVKLDAIPYTFIVTDAIEKNDISGLLHSNQRAPLVGRKSKRAEKLALVIRPPDGSTILRLVSRDEEPRPLEGYEVWSRRPGMSKDEKSEFIGKTDWKGEISVPPSDDLRLLLVKRGNRPLAKLPVIPGFHRYLETSITNDDTSLQAEGVVQGLQSEVINLVALRALYENRITNSIKDKQFDRARGELREYTDLESPQELSARLADEEIRLRSLTTNPREQERIKGLFLQLRRMVNSDLVKTREVELRDWINARRIPDSAVEQEAEQPAAIVSDDEQ